MATLRCTSFGDLHGQKLDKDAYERMMQDCAKDTDIWFILGDVLDGTELSPWGGSYVDTRLVDEHNLLVEFMANHVRRIKPSARVIVTSGNHGKGRSERMWGSNPYHQDVLSVIMGGYAMGYVPMEGGGKAWQAVKAHEWPNVYYRPGLNSWVAQCGTNTILGHFEQASQLVDTTKNSIMNKYLRPRWPDARIIVQAHTHRQAVLKDGPFVYCEQGCMCKVSDYNDARGRSKWAPIRKGYARFEYDTTAKLVDPLSVHAVDLGWETGFSPACQV